MQINNRKLKIKGDTLIEVLFATSVFSLITVGSLAIMNQGTQMAQRSLEITLVRNEIDAQAATLRFLNSSYVSAYQNNAISYTGFAGEWQKIIMNSNTSPSNFINDTKSCQEPPTATKKFILNSKLGKYMPISSGFGGNFKLADTFSRVEYGEDNSLISAYGIWVEPVRSDGGTIFTDFYIRACWSSAGQSVPSTIGTIVRLYEPK